MRPRGSRLRLRSSEPRDGYGRQIRELFVAYVAGKGYRVFKPEPVDQPGNAARVFKAIGDANLNIDMIIQNTSREGEARISFTLHKNDLKKAREVLEAAARGISDKVEITAKDGIAKVSAVGIGMRSHSGVAAIMFGSLGDAGINIDMISTSEIKIAVIVDEKDQENAVRTVHAAFRLHEAGVTQ